MHRNQLLAYAAAAVMVGGTLVGATTVLAGPDNVSVAQSAEQASTETDVIGSTPVVAETTPEARAAPAPVAASDMAATPTPYGEEEEHDGDDEPEEDEDEAEHGEEHEEADDEHESY